ncbi:MAG: folate-binding protein [Alphaproteobacteria bacterium]|nr:folate-binding protein [Alphaproteobacteria bacterium]MDA8010502.1 folate-binding protein [Alphaproteobacteria bacterium]
MSPRFDLASSAALPMPSRGIVTVGGADRVSFLQGLVTQNVETLAADEARWSAFLTPQGKYLHDFFMFVGDGVLFLECEAERAQDLVDGLGRYRLRAQVELSVAAAEVFLVPGGGVERGKVRRGDGWCVFGDPRRGEDAARLVCLSSGAAVSVVADAEAARREWEGRRIRAGWMDGSRDLEIGRDLPAEAGMDLQGAIDWEKGCYLGQEITARVHYRGLLKRFLVPVRVEGEVRTGDVVEDGAGRKAGVLRSVVNGDEHWGLALLRRDVEGLNVNGMTAEKAPAPWQQTN